VDIRRLGADDVRRLIESIDRTQHVDVEHVVVDGVLQSRPARFADIPPWAPAGDDHAHGVDAQVAFVLPHVERGALLFVAHDGDVPVGGAVVDPAYDPPLGWLVWLHVTSAHRGTGVGTALWAEAVGACRAGGATTMYVSATPTGPTVGFYLARGCRLADPPRPELFEPEPDDIHLVCDL
jgi:GNAT superfamily N-acetyltransferase